MYTGTLINDLIATVERAETSPRLRPEPETTGGYWYELAPRELASYQLAGVA